MTAPRLFQGMSAHDDILDGQVSWWLEHGKAVELLVAVLFLCGVAFLMAVLR